MDDFIYSESPCCMMHPNKFLLKRIYGWEVFGKIPRRLFSAWSSFVSKWNERSIYQSLFGLKHPIKFLLMRTYRLEEDFVWQISRLLFSSWPSWYLIYSEPPFSRGHMFLKKLLEEFQDGCLMHGHLWYLNGMIWVVQALHFALVSAQEDIWFGRRYCLKYWRQLPWWHNTQILPVMSLQSPV